jgi:hypothetical protein
MKKLLLMTSVTKLIARCRMLLLQRSTLAPFTPLYTSACSLIRICRSFKFKMLALLHASPILLLPYYLHHALKTYRRHHSRAPIKRPTRSPMLPPLGCIEPHILTLQRRSWCRRDAALFANKLVTMLLSALRKRSKGLCRRWTIEEQRVENYIQADSKFRL